MALYEDRIFAYQAMQQLDKVIDDEPELAGKMVAMDERNRLAFLELESYQSSKKFLYKHPILRSYKIKNKLDALRKSDPERFMKDLINASKAIARYESKINNKKYKSEEELLSWRNLIKDYKEKLELMKACIS
mgnify:CR=1 FL=1